MSLSNTTEVKYTIYKTTNMINGKSYIGKHICRCDPCKYIGSGKLLKRAIQKYGRENFKREILFECATEDEMNLREKELVVRDDMSYNLCEGGQGGFGYLNKNIWTTEKRQKICKPISVEQCRENGLLTKEKKIGLFDPKHQSKRLENLIASNVARTGWKHSEETKEKMRVAIKNRKK